MKLTWNVTAQHQRSANGALLERGGALLLHAVCQACCRPPAGPTHTLGAPMFMFTHRISCTCSHSGSHVYVHTPDLMFMFTPWFSRSSSHPGSRIDVHTLVLMFMFTPWASTACMCASVCSPTHLSTHPSIHPFICPPTHQSIHPSIHPPIHPSIQVFTKTPHGPSHN